MFKSPTLFIVGAGASCEAGLPSNVALKSQIADLLDIKFPGGWQQTSGDTQITHALREAVKAAGQNDINPYLHKAWRIRDVVPTTAISIDNYLDAHKGDSEMELCGKLAIVKSILSAEANSKLKVEQIGFDKFSLNELSGTWYSYFFQMLTENVHKSEVKDIFKNIKIITFNYDRCIERYLVQALADYYDLEITEAESIVSTLSIYHPYGQVGYLPWQGKEPNLPFGSTETGLLSLANQIKTFTEGLDDQDLIKKIHSAVETSETLVFLGFAFHPINMKLLTPPPLTEGQRTQTRRIFATTFGLSAADAKVIENDIYDMIGVYRSARNLRKNPEVFLADMTCGDFFIQYFRSLSAATF